MVSEQTVGMSGNYFGDMILAELQEVIVVLVLRKNVAPVYSTVVDVIIGVFNKRLNLLHDLNIIIIPRPPLNPGRVMTPEETLLKKTKGEFAVTFKDLAIGEEVLINEHTVFLATSTMKTPVMIEAFKQAKEESLP